MPRRRKLGSESGPAIALCSDAHAQSINLPAASAVVHLDFPTVPRLAEQRVGRVDRLDSPHAEVSVYYPDGHADFALRADEKFFERHHLVAELLGANIPLPELTRRLEAEKGRVIDVDDANEEPSVGDQSVSAWDDLSDALAPVKPLGGDEEEGGRIRKRPTPGTRLKSEHKRLGSAAMDWWCVRTATRQPPGA